MPALPSPGNVIRAQLQWNGGGSTGFGTRWYMTYTGGPPSAANLTTLNGAIATQFVSHLQSLISSSYTMDLVTTTDLSSSTGAEVADASSNTGTRTGGATPLNSCTVVDYVINRRYRGGKPRGYWPFGTMTDLGTEQTWGSSFLTLVNTDFGAFMAGVLGTTGIGVTLVNHVNVSFYSGFTNYTGSGGRAKVRANVRATPLVDTVQTHNAREIIGSQRRRL